MTRSRRRLIILLSAALLLLAATLLPSPSTSTAVLVYEMLRRCPEPQPRLVKAQPFLVIGHRGAAADMVENTIPSMQKALELGANAVEIDLCITADRRVVLWHDWDPDDPIANGRDRGAEPEVLCVPHFPDDGTPMHRTVDKLTLEELRAHYGYEPRDGDPSEKRKLPAVIPTLEEFLAWAAGESRLRAVLFDLKIPEKDSALAPAYIRTILDALRSTPLNCEQIFLTPHRGVHRAIDSMLPEGNLSLDLELPGGILLDPCDDNSSVETAIAANNRVASIMFPYSGTIAPYTTARRIVECDLERRRAHRPAAGAHRVERLIAATINDESQMECLIALGVDGIVTDHPDMLRQVAARMGIATQGR